MKRSLPRAVSAAVVTGLLALPSHAADVVKVQLRACPTGTAVGEVNSCGKIWKLGAGDASLDASGNFKAMVKGLVLNDPTTAEFNGTADGVAHVVGSVLCGGSVAGQTEWVPLSKSGDATIKA